MKKEDIAGLVVYMLIIAVAIVYSLTILQTHYVHSSVNNVLTYTGFVLLALVVGIVSSAILLELGHVLGAVIGKYTITSVCILHLTLLKTEKKWKLCFKGYDGLTGETKIIPKNEKSSPFPFHFLGSVLLTLWGVGCIAIFYIFNNDPSDKLAGDIAYFFLTVALVVFLCLVYNILPIKLDSTNDGYALRLVSNQKNKKNYNLMLETDTKKTNEEDLIVHTDITNITTELNMKKVYALIKEEKYQEAEDIVDISIAQSNKISAKFLLKNVGMKIYLKAMKGNTEELLSYIDQEIDLNFRKRLIDDRNFISLRAFLIVEAFADKSKNECMLALNKVNNIYKVTPKNDQEIEIEMYNKVITLIDNNHPKWEMSKYIINK